VKLRIHQPNPVRVPQDINGRGEAVE